MLSTIRLGSTGDDVRRFQRYLQREVTFDAMTPSGVFGPAEDTQARKIQADNGLLVDGVVGPATWAVLPRYLEASPELRRGDAGPVVSRLQAALNRSDRAPTPPLIVDGVFGPVTEAAVRSFQQQSNVLVTGVVDEGMWFTHAFGPLSVSLEHGALLDVATTLFDP